MSSSRSIVDELSSLLQKAVTIILERPECMVDDTFPDRFAECLELLVDNFNADNSSPLEQPTNDEASVLVQDFSQAALCSSSTKLQCLGLRATCLCPQVLLLETVQVSFRSAATSECVSVRNAVFVAAKSLLASWPTLPGSKPCPLRQAWFVALAVHALHDGSLFVAAAARQFLCVALEAECRQQAGSDVHEVASHPPPTAIPQDNAVRSTLSGEAKACAQCAAALKTSRTETSALIGKRKYVQRDTDRLAAFLRLLIELVQDHADVPLGVVRQLLRTSSVLGMVSTAASDEPLRVVSVVRRSAQLTAALCNRLSGAADLQSYMRSCGWSFPAGQGEPREDDCQLLLSIPLLLLRHGLLDSALNLLIAYSCKLHKGDPDLATICAWYLSAPIHLAAGVRPKTLLELISSGKAHSAMTADFGQWLSAVLEVMNTKSPFTSLLSFALPALEEVMKLKLPEILASSLLSSAVHLLTESCYCQMHVVGEAIRRVSVHAYDNEKLVRMLIGYVSGAAAGSELLSIGLCVSVCSDSHRYCSPLSAMMDALNMQQHGTAVTIRLLSVIRDVLAAVPANMLASLLATDDAELCGKRQCHSALPFSRLFTSEQCDGTADGHTSSVSSITSSTPPAKTSSTTSSVTLCTAASIDYAPPTCLDSDWRSLSEYDCSTAPPLVADSNRQQCAPVHSSSSVSSAGTDAACSNTYPLSRSCSSPDTVIRTNASTAIGGCRSDDIIMTRDDVIRTSSCSSAAVCSSADASSSTGTSVGRYCAPVGSTAEPAVSVCGVAEDGGGGGGGTVQSVGGFLSSYLRNVTVYSSWEVRDTLINMVTVLLRTHGGQADLLKFLDHSQFFHFLQLAGGDSSAFVSSSALLTLPVITGSSSVLDAYLSANYKHTGKIGLVKDVLSVLSGKKNEFHRRSAVQVLCDWLRQDGMAMYVVPFAHAQCDDAGDDCSAAAQSSTRTDTSSQAGLYHEGCTLCREWQQHQSSHAAGMAAVVESMESSDGASLATSARIRLPSVLCTNHCTLVDAMLDFDWEVKLRAVQFWSCVLLQILPECHSDTHNTNGVSPSSQASSKPGAVRLGERTRMLLQPCRDQLLDWLCLVGVCQRLAAMTDDCDDAVRDAATSVITQLAHLPQTSSAATHDDTDAAVHDGKCHDDAVDFPDAFTSGDQFLHWCRRWSSYRIRTQHTEWPVQAPAAGFEPFSFLSDILHHSRKAAAAGSKGSNEDGENAAEEVIVDCY